MRQESRWLIPLRAALAAMWLVHGLEKFGIKWPVWLGGGTHSVPDMLDLMAEVTPLPLVAFVIDRLMVPLAPLFQYPVGVLEIALSLAMASGVWLIPAALLGLSMQTLFFFGFVTLEWPYQYLLVMAAHLILVLAARTGDSAFAAPVSARFGWFAGLVTAAGLLLVVMAWRAESWGSWPWAYFMVVAWLLALSLRWPPALPGRLSPPNS